MRRIEFVKVGLACLCLTAACRPHRRPAAEGKPRWSFGVPRGTSVEAGGRSPIQLTASDGTGLKLVSLEARVAIEGPLAFTELTLGFENPEARTLEGHFDVVLPPGAAVSRFAMKLPSGWQEAEVVEKQAARVAYEDFLHRRQDPALLEKAAGNEFSARVFPIAPRAVKEIKLSYSEELASVDEPYRLALRGLPLVPALQIVVFAGETAVRVARQQFTPDADFLLERPGAASGLQSGKLVVARLRPPLPSAPSAMGGVVILFDTSASRAPGFARQVRELGALVEELRRVHGDGLPLRVASFDQAVAPIYEGTAGGFVQGARALLDGLQARGALGASDVAGALAWAATHAAGDGQHQRLVLVTDGVATASAAMVAGKLEEAGDDAIAMGRAADGLKPRFDRLDVVLVGGIRDDVAMRAIASHHLAEDGAIVDGAEGAERIVRRLDQTTRSGVRVSVAGAAWVWPTQVDGMQRGDDLIVYAEMADDRDRASVSVALAGPVSLTTDVPLASPDNPGLRPLVERAWARARIASLGVEAAKLVPAEYARAAAVHQEILDLSTRYRVLSDYTSLLVLESDADYARFHIDRTALSDILVVDGRGLRLEQRRAPVAAAPPKEEDDGFMHLFKKATKTGGAEEKEKDKADVARAVDGERGRDSRPFQLRGGPQALGNEDSASARAVDEPPGRAMGAEPTVEAPRAQGGLGGVGGVGGLGARGIGMGGGGSGASGAPSSLRGNYEVNHEVAAAPDRQERRALAAEAAAPPPPPRPEPMASRRAAMGYARPRSRAINSFDALAGDSMGGLDGLMMGAANQAAPEDSHVPSLTGRMLEIHDLIAAKKLDAALAGALGWHDAEPGDVLALVALGDVRRAQGKLGDAARAYGSIIDLFPARADLRRFAGALLESLGDAGEALAADSFAHAARDRADHPNSHRLRAYSLLRAGHLPEAFAAIEAGAARTYPPDRFRGVDQILREDCGLIGAAWLARDPSRRAEVAARLAKVGAALPTGPSLRFVLSWETDANDVDFHITDKAGNRAWFSQKHLASGGDLYADVTTGYGPECFTIEGKPTAYPYRIQAHYYSRGPMGYGMGKVEIISHDGKGGLAFEERPYVVMNDHAFVDLGEVATAPAAK